MLLGVPVRVTSGYMQVDETTGRIISRDDDVHVLPNRINRVIILYHRHWQGIYSDEEFASQIIDMIESDDWPEQLNPFEEERRGPSMILARDVNGYSKGSYIYPENNLKTIAHIMRIMGEKFGLITTV
jgi:hypothetical protein